MDDIVQGEDPPGLFSKRSSSNILSDPRILAHLRIVAEEAQSSDKDAEQDEESEWQNARRELGEKIAAYNKGNHHGAFRLILKDDLSFEGALRFYFEDGKEELMKTVRLTNKTLVSELLPTLIEKFKPDLVNSNVQKKAKIYVRHEQDEICLDPSDAPLDIALNAKKLPRFVLRLDVKKAAHTAVDSAEEALEKAAVPNGTALSSSVAKPSSLNPSLSSVHSTGNESNSTLSTAGVNHVKHDSLASSNKPFAKSKTPPQATKGTNHNSRMPSLQSPRSEKGRNFFSSPRSALGMFFDGGRNQQDQSSHAAQKLTRGKRQRKRSFGLKLKKQMSEKSLTELSTDQLAPGILKVFGDHVSPGSNYKSVRAMEMTTADEIVVQALERYSLSSEKGSDYVLCDVIGYFEKRFGSLKNKERNMEEDKWITEYARVIGDKEKPLVLQQLWKPVAGFSRRFELRRRIETHDSSFLKPRGSIALLKAVSVHDSQVPAAVKERRGTEESDSSHSISAEDHHSATGGDEGGSSGRTSLIISPLVAPLDAPYILLLKGFDNGYDLLFHRLDEQIAMVGRHAHPIHGHGADIILYAPDILLHHSTLRKKVEMSSSNLDSVEGNVNFTVYLEPCRAADVSVNGVFVSSSVELNPGDLISFGRHYIFLFKDASQVADNLMTLPWVDDLRTIHRCQTSQKLKAANVVRTRRLGGMNDDSTANYEDALAQYNPSNRLRLPYHAQDEDDLIDMITNIVDLPSDGYKLSPAYLLIMCIEHSARYHGEVQTRQLLLKISNTIQTIASEKTSEMSKTIERTSVPEQALEELLPQLRPVIFWMANCLEMLSFLQHNMCRYVGDPAEVTEHGEDVLYNADEEMLMFLEEVVIYTFQQTVYHLTKVLYIALPAILDTNPFQDNDEDTDKKPQEVETVIGIFQTTHDVVREYCVHEDIVHQLFAYLFFFTNASLFNTLMERGAGGKFYRWSKGAQIRGNLDLLESWSADVQLQDEANEYLIRLSTAADLLATPKVQLLQADWTTIRRDFPALNAAQVQQLLGEYQLGPGKSRPRGWFPPPEEVEPALRTADILLSFADHPSLKLPAEGYVLDLETGPTDSSFYLYLDAINQAMNPGGGAARFNLSSTVANGPHRVQQLEREAEAKASQVLPTSSAPESSDHVPELVVSPASPGCVSRSGESTSKFSFQTVISASPPAPTTKDGDVPSFKGRKSSAPMDRSETPPRRQDKPPTPGKPKAKDPRPDIVHGGEGTASKQMCRSDSGAKQPDQWTSVSLEEHHLQSPSAKSPETGQKDKESKNRGNVVKDENQNVSTQSKLESGGLARFTDDNSKWVEVTGDSSLNTVDSVDGLSVLPVEDLETNENLAVQIAIDPTIETSEEFDEKRALQKAKLLSRLKSDSEVDIVEQVPPRRPRGYSVRLEGMRENDDRQDDVFIVELEKGGNGIGLGLIDGLYTTLRAPGIYVRTLVAGGPAMKDGRLRLGDRILAVNGTSLVGADYQSAMQQIRQAGNHLSFLVAKSDIHVAMQITASSC